MGKSESNASSQTKRRLLHLHIKETSRWIQVIIIMIIIMIIIDQWIQVTIMTLHYI